MADQTSERSSAGLALIVGALLVADIVIALAIFDVDLFGNRDIDVDVNLPPVQSPPATIAPAQPEAPSGSTQQ
jgi:hypothetical protein